MEGIEAQIGSVLNNPQLMEQIMQMAQSLGQPTPEPTPEPVREPELSGQDLDPAAMTKLLSIASKAGIDQNQKALLQALRPYLTPERLRKLEKAMRASKLAGIASSALGSGALSFLTGR